MAKIIACNTEINKIIYSGYTIDKIYACGGELVYGNSSPTVPPNWKENFFYNDGSSYYAGVNFSTSGNVAYSDDFANYVYTYNGSSYEYEYNTYYRGTSAITNNVSAMTINCSKVDTISANTFSGCKSLVSVSSSCCDGVATIGNNAFKDCSALTHTNVTYASTTIGNSAFQNTNLHEVIMNNVVTIGNLAFDRCQSTSFHNVNLPATLANMGVQAFSNCIYLREVVCYATTPPIMDSAFYNCHSSLAIYVPASSVDTYKAANGWKAYASIIQAIPNT